MIKSIRLAARVAWAGLVAGAMCAALLVAGLDAAGVTRISFGGTLPTACASGNIYVKTGGSPGLHWCSTPGNPGTWTLLGSSSGSSGGLVLLESHTASASSSLDFTSRNAAGQSGATFQGDFNVYEIVFANMIPATTDDEFVFQVSTDGGSSWITASSSYYYVAHWSVNSPGDGAFTDGSFATTYGLIAETVGSSSTYQGASGTLRVWNPTSATAHKWKSFGVWLKDSTQMVMEDIFTLSVETSAVNAVRFKFAGSNITSGEVDIYGLE